jgi:hypothetical protein
MYAHNRCTDWSHGYAIQVVDTKGGFHHINIPIQNGRSAMPSLIKTMA